MASIRRRLKNKKPPEGWELIEEVIEDFELQVIHSGLVLLPATPSQVAAAFCGFVVLSTCTMLLFRR